MTSDAKYNAKDELVSSLARLRAEREVEELLSRSRHERQAADRLREMRREEEAAPPPPEASEQQQRQRRRGEDQAPPPPTRETYLAMSLAEVRQLKVQDLRLAVAALGLPAGGNRFEMAERIQDHLEAQRAAKMVSGASSAEDLMR